MIEPKDISVRVMTCPREPMYLHITMANLFMSGPSIWDVAEVKLFTDAPNKDVLKPYHHLPYVDIHCRNKEEQLAWEEAAKKIMLAGKEGKITLPVHWRFNYNLWSILNHPLPEGCKALLVIEDDVYVKEGIIDHLCEMHSEMLADGVSSFVVTLQDNHNVKTNPRRRRGKFYSSSPSGSHYGTVGIYYSPDMVNGFKKHLRAKGINKYTAPGDMLLKEFVHKKQNLYVSGWDLVSHEGIVSTGLGGGGGSRDWFAEWRALTTDDFGKK